MKSKNPPNTGRLETRRRAALDLRQAGMTYEEVADHLRADPSIPTPKSYDRSRCWRDVNLALDRLRSETTESARQLVDLETRRLDALQEAHWDAAVSGDVNATKIVLSVMERRSRLLGLDAPQRSKLETTTPLSPAVVTAEIARLEAKLSESDNPTVRRLLDGIEPNGDGYNL